MATVTITFPGAETGVNFAVSKSVAQFLDENPNTPISISTTATGTYNLTSIGVFVGGNTVWRLRNGTGSTATSSNLSRSGGGFSKTLDLPANTDTFVRSTGGGTHILKIGTFVNTKAANTVQINTTNTSSTGTTRIALLNLADSYNITGSNSNDTLTGADAADTINGGQGNDTLTGGGGNDSLTGGTGADRFVFTNQGNDVITDFAAGSGNDVFAITSSAYTGAPAASTTAVVSNAASATDASSSIVVDTSANITALGSTKSNIRFAFASDNNNLLYDADGDWSSGSITVANTNSISGLVSGNFAFI